MMKPVNNPSIIDLTLDDSEDDCRPTKKPDKKPFEVDESWKVNEKYKIEDKLGEGGGGSVFSGNYYNFETNFVEQLILLFKY